MNKWPDPGKTIVTNIERPSNIWTRAVYYEGLMALYNVDRQPKYYDYAVLWGEKHKWGLRGGVSTRNGDNQACAQTYIDLYLVDKKPERIKDIKASIDLMVKSEKADDWDWIDALQMAMPVFTRLGLFITTQVILERCTTCTTSQRINMETKACIIQRTVYGGAIRTSIRLTKNQMAKIVTGAVVMGG
jgi:rhamnogalacturonyl hydrolase YesR